MPMLADKLVSANLAWKNRLLGQTGSPKTKQYPHEFSCLLCLDSFHKTDLLANKSKLVVNYLKPKTAELANISLLACFPANFPGY